MQEEIRVYELSNPAVANWWSAMKSCPTVCTVPQENYITRRERRQSFVTLPSCYNMEKKTSVLIR